MAVTSLESIFWGLSVVGYWLSVIDCWFSAFYLLIICIY